MHQKFKVEYYKSSLKKSLLITLRIYILFSLLEYHMIIFIKNKKFQLENVSKINF